MPPPQHQAEASPPEAIEPFFIVGAPRTGTTLLRRQLCGHPRVAVPPESRFVAEYLAAAAVPLEVRKQLLLREPDLAHWGIALREDDLDSQPSMAACLELIHRRYAAQRGKDVWGNKTPKLVRDVDLLAQHFPRCRFLHMVRDGRGVARSLRQSRAHELHPLHAARRYAADVAHGLRLERLWPQRTLRVRYEELVGDPERVLREVVDFLGLDFDEAVLAGASGLLLTPSEERAGHHSRVEEPVDTSRIDRWRSELSPDDVALIESVAGPALEQLGYPLLAVGRVRRRDLASAQAHMLLRTVRVGLRELRSQPDPWGLLRRRVKLGSYRRILSEFVTGH